MNISKFLPGLAWYRDYNRSALWQDVLSGLTIAAMLIPQGMAYAMVAGLPAEYGLYACIVPPIIYALLGTSNKLSIGPVALDSILILSGLSLLAEPGSDSYLELAVALTFMVGFIQLALGFVKGGFIANFLSYPIILGYTCAAAIIIMGTQLESLLGLDIDADNVFVLIIKTLQSASLWHLPTLGIALLGFFFLIVPKRWVSGLPYGLLLIVIGMAASGIWGAQHYGVSVLSHVPQGLPKISLPDLSLEVCMQLLPTALTVALMGYVGSMSICKAQEKPDDKIHVNPNQELFAVGAANFAGSLFRAFPVSASFSRSAAFVKSGAMTQMSAVTSSLVLVVVLMFLSPAFISFPLPRVLLAVIIVTSVFGLFKYKEMKALYRKNRHEFILMLFTFLITLWLGVQQGILIGVGLSVIRIVYLSTKPHMTELGAIRGGSLYRNVNRFDDVVVREDMLIFRFDAPLYFANKDYFSEKLYAWIGERDSKNLRVVIFDAEAVNSIDVSAEQMLEKVITNLKQRGINFYITNAIGPVRDELLKSDLKEYFSKERMFASIQGAIEFVDHGTFSDAEISLQTGQKDKF